MTEEELEKVIGDHLRESNRAMSLVAGFGYPVAAINLYLEGKEDGNILTSENGDIRRNADMVIASPVLSLIAYAQDQERQGVLIEPEQKDVLRDEALILGQLLAQAQKILEKRLEWLGPKTAAKLIVQQA